MTLNNVDASIDESELRAPLADGSRVMFGALVAGALVVAGGSVVRRYRQEMRAARARLASVDRAVITTEHGDVEYMDSGAGDPLLVSHGVFQNPTSVMMLRDLMRDRRIIAPCRFGYLGSSLPPDASPRLQADVFVALLDTLEIDTIDVVGISAGATSVLELALHHPDRVKHVVVLSGNLPGATTAVVQPSWARLLDRQFPMWAIKTAAPSTMAYFAGVPKRLALTSEQRQFVADFIDGMFPVDPIVAGVEFDVFVSNAAVNDCELEAIAVPTLLVHARDDPLVRYGAAERAAQRIPGAHLLSLETGGHLLIGQVATVQQQVAEHLASPSSNRATVPSASDERKHHVVPDRSAPSGR